MNKMSMWLFAVIKSTLRDRMEIKEQIVFVEASILLRIL